MPLVQQPDGRSAWADECWRVIAQEQLHARVDDWLTVHCSEADHEGTTLQPLATVRFDNRRQST